MDNELVSVLSKQKTKMNQQDRLWVTLVNVPREMTLIDVPHFFVEIRAEAISLNEKEKPYAILKFNNLNSHELSLIRWSEFCPLIQDIVNQHFEQIVPQEKNILVIPNE